MYLVLGQIEYFKLFLSHPGYKYSMEGEFISIIESGFSRSNGRRSLQKHCPVVMEVPATNRAGLEINCLDN